MRPSVLIMRRSRGGSRLLSAPTAVVQLEDVASAGAQMQSGNVLVTTVAIEGSGVPGPWLGDLQLQPLSAPDGGTGEQIGTPQLLALRRVVVEVLTGRVHAFRLGQVQRID